MKHLLVHLLSFLLSVSAFSWQNSVNIPRSGSLKSLAPTQLSYELSWNGRLKAGNIDMIFGKKDPRYPKHYLAQAWGGSTGWAHVLYPFQFNYISFLNPRTLRPLMFSGNEIARKRTSTYNFRFTSKNVTGTKKVDKGGKGKNRTEKRTFKYPNTLDLFSGLLQIRSLPLLPGQTYRMPFYPVGKPYLATIKVLGREKHLGRSALKLNLTMERIDDNMRLKNYEKLKGATVWISDDQWRIPLEVRAAVFVGDVRMRLTEQKAL